MAKEKPEARLIRLARKASKEYYGVRIREFKHHGSAFAEAGVHDVIVCLDGAFGSCEFKAPETYGNDPIKALRVGPTLNQRTYAREVNAAGGFAWFASTIEHWMLGLAAMEARALNLDYALPDLVSGNTPICTCPKGACEWDLLDEAGEPYGCFYCRTAPETEPCPTNPTLMV